VSTAGGCTPARWVHPEYGTARLAEDEHACTTIAREEAWRADTSGGTVLRSRREFPNSALDDYDLLGTEPPLDLPLRLRDTCMRAKGYQLTQ